MQVLKATKDLVNGCNGQDFTKGKEYEVKHAGYQWAGGKPNEATVVIDDTGTRHTLGTWCKHFKVVRA